MFTREGYKFDVGSSMMFGMGQEGTTNLITKALQAVGKELETMPDPTQIHYHLPKSDAHPQVLLNVVCLHRMLYMKSDMLSASVNQVLCVQ